MQKSKTLIAILLCALTAAAGCGDAADVTAPSTSVAESPLFDGGGWVGSGNRTDTTSTNPTSTSTPSGTSTEDDPGTGRGGGWVGSGN